MSEFKDPGQEKYMLASEIAAYLGVTSRTVRNWMHDPTFPKPERNSKGYKVWSPEQARRCLKWRMKRVPPVAR